MFVRFGKFFIVLSLVAMLGAHWALLQAVAWTTMLAGNLQSNSFRTAMVHTFDGKHPCCLCKAIAAGKHSEQKQETIVQLQKLDFLPLKTIVTLFPPADFAILSVENASADPITVKPLLEPPRSSVV